MTIIARPPDSPPALRCDCPTSTTRGSLIDRVDTMHRPSCRTREGLGLGAGASLTSSRYETGTLDALLDEQFGPAVAGELLAHVTAERFGRGTR